MGNETRATMIEGAIQLLATRGVHGASLLKVLEHTGAPRGSVYHHFPGGKEDLILAALDLTGQRHDRFVDRFRGTSATEITAGYLDLWRRILVRSRLESEVPHPRRYRLRTRRSATGPGRRDLPDLSTAPRRPLRRNRCRPFSRRALRDHPRRKRRGRRRSLASPANHRALRGSRRPTRRTGSGDATRGVLASRHALRSDRSPAQQCVSTRHRRRGHERSQRPQAPHDGVGKVLTGL